MVTIFYILSAMFLALFILDIPMLYVTIGQNNERKIFVMELSMGLTAGLCIICLLVVWGIILG